MAVSLRRTVPGELSDLIGSWSSPTQLAETRPGRGGDFHVPLPGNDFMGRLFYINDQSKFTLGMKYVISGCSVFG